MPPRISIITPSFNQGRFIEATIQSVLAQGIADLEYVVYDNCSQDRTLEILEKYTPHLRWVSEPDQGQAQAVNKGIGSTQGEIIGWLNSDDVYYPNALRTVLDYFDTHAEVDVIYGEADHIDPAGLSIEPYYTEPWNLERLKDVCYLSQPAVFFRRHVVDKFGLLDERLKYCMDYEYWLRLGLGGARFDHLPEKLAGSRLYPETKTLGSKIKVHAEINDMLRRRLGRAPDRWLFNYAHAVLEQRGPLPSKRVRFAVAVCLHSLWAALRWNHSVSAAMLQTCWRWLGGAVLQTYREMAGR